MSGGTMGWAALLLHCLLVSAAVPLLAALGGYVEARMQGRPAAFVQPWRDVARLWAKGAPVPQGATALFAAGPPAAVAAAVLALVLVPSFSLGSAAGPGADLVLLLGLLAVPQGALTLATLDGGTAPALGQAGAVRLGAWPVCALVAMAALLLSGGTNLPAAAAAVRDGGGGARLAGVLAGAAVFALTVSQPGLPMRGFGGRHRALVHLAGWVQRTAALSVVAALSGPYGLAQPGAGLDGWALATVGWTLKMAVLAALAAAVGTRIAAAPALRPGAAVLAVMAVVLSGTSGPA